MSEITMLVLIGGRSVVPAVAGALQFLNEIDRVKFLICDRKQYQDFQKNAENILKQEKSNLICNKGDTRIVNPNIFIDVYNNAQELCDGVVDLKYVNLTSAPQTMAIAVYSFITQTYKDAFIFSVNTDQSKLIPLTLGKSEVQFNRNFSVENYVIACGHQIFKKGSSLNNVSLQRKEMLSNLVKYMAQYLDISGKTIDIIRKRQPNKNAQLTVKFKSHNLSKQANFHISDSEYWKFLKNLEDASIIQDLELNQDRGEGVFSISSENYKFMDGGWLELFTYISAK